MHPGLHALDRVPLGYCPIGNRPGNPLECRDSPFAFKSVHGVPFGDLSCGDRASEPLEGRDAALALQALCHGLDEERAAAALPDEGIDLFDELLGDNDMGPPGRDVTLQCDQ
jgi:hypothetical protein